MSTLLILNAYPTAWMHTLQLNAYPGAWMPALQWPPNLDLKASDVFAPCTWSTCYRLQTKFAKAMFLHLSVSHFVHRGCLPQCMLGYTPLGQTPPWADIPLGRNPQQTATTADGMHPTGMHSCFWRFDWWYWRTLRKGHGCRREKCRRPWAGKLQLER